MDKFFYRINNFLIITVILFLSILAVTKARPAHSVQDLFSQYFNNSTVAPTPTGGAPYIIGKTVDVEFKPSNFKVAFISNGNSESISAAQEIRLSPDSSGNRQLAPIPVPLTFDINKAYVELPGELVYPAIRKASAPLDLVCNEKLDKNNPQVKENCLFNVTSLSVFTDLTKRQVLYSYNSATDTQLQQTQNGGSVFDQLFKALDIVNSINSFIVAATGVPDQQRSAIGTIEWWADDELQALARVNGRLVEQTVPRVHSTAVNQSEGYFASDFSSGIESTVLRKNMRVNIYQGVKEDIGFGNISDPFTSAKDGITENPGTGLQQPGSILEAVGAFITKVTENYFKAPQKQEKLSVQVALRTVNETDEFTVAYNLCTALEKMNAGYRPYPNPYGSSAPRKWNEQKQQYENDEPNFTYWYNYENKVSDKDKRCISALVQYVDEGKTGQETRAYNCAKGMAERPDIGCQEFSVEDDGLNFEMIQKSLPIGFGSYFQNGTLNTLSPDNDGPFFNALSPYFCAKLNIVYDISKGDFAKDYIYSYGAKSQDPKVKFSSSPGDKKQVNNQYCVISSLLSNFSWTLYHQDRYFGSNNFGKINMPKEALTCDKKETAIVGGSFIKSNIQSPQGKLLYINEDNVRGAQDTEDVLLNHGYTPFSLRDVVDDEDIKASLYKYRDSDFKVLVDSVTQRPKYVLVVVDKGEKDKRLGLCKIERTKPNGEKEKMCKMLVTSDWLLTGDVSMFSSGGKDIITIVDYKGQNEEQAGSEEEQRRNSGNSKEEKGPAPVRYMFVEADPSNMAQSRLIMPGENLTSGVSTKFDTLQLGKGSMGVLLTQYTEGKLSKMYVIEIDPVTRSVRQLTKDICSLYSDCQYLNNLQGWPQGKLVQDVETSTLYVVMVAGGVGVAYPVAVNKTDQDVPHFMFAYKKNSNSYKDAEDYISSLKFQNQELHIFMQRSGYYLRVIFPWKEYGILKQGNIAKDVQSKCSLNDGTPGSNCLLTVQYEFNPNVFTSDCSDYLGNGACGYPKLDPLGQPVVMDFYIQNSGKIQAWYKYSKLRNTILESNDMLFSYTGVYSQVNGEEYTNAYIPDPKNKFQAQPMRYFYYGTNGLNIGEELEKNGETITEIIQVMKPDKYRCLQNMVRVTGVDIFTSQTGIEAVNVNDSSLLNPIAPPGSSSTAGSSFNSGEYCEETWCVPDEVDFINGAIFGGDTNDTALKTRITTFFTNRRVPQGPQYSTVYRQYEAKVNYMCAESSKNNVSCAALAAIWLQESGGSLGDNAALGCFGESIFGATWRTFETQVRCAIGSLENSARMYANGNTLSGPGSLTDSGSGAKNGTCKPATLFSMAMQRYTPTDRRINFNNQCNKGLVIRDDQDQCISDMLVGGAAAGESAFNASTTAAAWPKGNLIQSRKNLQFAMQKLDPRLKADNKNCFPASSGGTVGSTNDPNIENVKKEYGLVAGKNDYTTKVGVFKMNWANWGTSWAAGNVAIALDGQMNSRGISGQRGIAGAHIIKPGQVFSFNEVLGNPTASEVIARYPTYQSKGYSFAGTTVVGGGWCELATTLREAADFVEFKLPDGTIRKLQYTQVRGGPNGYGFKGEIEHWDHGLPTSQFNDQLAVDGLRLNDRLHYVSMWSLGYSTDSDNDLLIRNPFPADSGVDMIIAVSVDSRKVITAEVFFGKKGTSSTQPKSTPF
jgi:hypothetical protein